MALVAHRALDGGLVEVDTAATGLDAGQPFSSYVHLKLGSHLQELVAGERGFADVYAEDLLGRHEVQETYSFQGGTLRIGAAKQVDLRSQLADELMVATWEGEHTSLYTFAYNARSGEELLAVLDQVRLSETAEGLGLAPVDPARTPIDEVCVLKELEPLGQLQIRRPDRDLVRSLPRWRGRQVAGGELFLDDSDPKQRFFVLVNETAYTHIIPDHPEQVESQLPAMAELTVRWTS